MAQDLIKSDVTIRNTKPTDKTIRLSDGDGLYLLVKPNGNREIGDGNRVELRVCSLLYPIFLLIVVCPLFL